MKHVVITGGAGFIGANLASYYLDKGYHVSIYDTLERKGSIKNLEWLSSLNQRGALDILIGDVRLPTRELRGAVEKADALFHLAGQVAVTTSVQNPMHDFEVNAIGTVKMLELVRTSAGKKPAFFYSSTNKVYGGMENISVAEHPDRYSYADLPYGIPEDRLLDFHSPYGCSKGAGDQYVRDYARIYDLQTVVFRQSCIYGYRQFGLEDQGWVAWFIIAAQLGLPIAIYGDGKQVRDVLFIDDLIAAYDQAFERIDDVSGQVFNVGGGPDNTICLHDLLDLIKTEIDPTLSVRYDDWRPGDQRVYVSDIRKAENVFGWAPETPWEVGARKLIAWVKENQPMLEGMFGNGRDRMPQVAAVNSVTNDAELV